MVMGKYEAVHPPLLEAATFRDWLTLCLWAYIAPLEPPTPQRQDPRNTFRSCSQTGVVSGRGESPRSSSCLVSGSRLSLPAARCCGQCSGGACRADDDERSAPGGEALQEEIFVVPFDRLGQPAGWACVGNAHQLEHRRPLLVVDESRIGRCQSLVAAMILRPYIESQQRCSSPSFFCRGEEAGRQGCWPVRCPGARVSLGVR
jgi:hypothetical protein